MNEIVYPLMPRMRNNGVAELQRALTALDYAIAETEIGNRRFGRTTRAAVAGFQAKVQLPATGRVDRATTEATGGPPAGSRQIGPTTVKGRVEPVTAWVRS